MKRVFTFLLVSALSVAYAQPRIVDGVVAVVGKNIVLKSDIDQQFAQLRRQGLASGESDKCKIFEELLFEKLLLHQADLDSIVVGDDEVAQNSQRRIDMIAQQIGSVQKMEQYYDKSVVEIREEMEPFIRDQMIAQRMLQKITGDVKITPTEVRNFYRKIPEDSLPLINSEVEYAQITKFPKPSPEAIQEAKTRLLELKQRVEDGSSFSTLAVLYSEDPGSAKNGGKYESIKRGQFVKEFEAVAFNLKEGEISLPFKTEYGYHIVQLLKRRGEELDLRHILIKPKISPENLKTVELYLDSVRQSILNKEVTFGDAAEKVSDDEDSRLNEGISINPNSGDSRWDKGELSRDIFVAIDGVEKGQISKPSFFRTPDGTEGYRLIKLLEKTEPHRADLKTDYQKIQLMATQEKKNEMTQTWIEEKLKTTYVRVNNDYLSCEFNQNWIKQSQYVE